MFQHPFELHDCSLVRYATGRSCANLRELLEALRTVSSAVLRHHMMRCALEDHFELYEFPNDLARWCWEALGERQLAEELALIDPYEIGDIERLRSAVVNTIEDRLWVLERVRWCRSGLELHLIESRLISFDTGERFTSLVSLAEALPRISRRSLYYHFHEAHQRQESDDISAWLERCGCDAEVVKALGAIDYYYLNLNQLRRQVLETLCSRMSEPQVVLGGVL